MKRLISYILSITILLSVSLSGAVVFGAENMIENMSQNEGMYAVPAPGEVKIDGDLSEWDWSGRINIFADYDYMDTYSGEVATMWDAENLYLGFKIKDPSPMRSLIDPTKEPGRTWIGDAIQLRMLTNRTPIWFTWSYFPEKQIASAFLVFWGSMTSNSDGEGVMYMTEPGGTKLTNYTIVDDKKPERIVTDAELAYKEFEDGTGYYVEAKIPWRMLYMTEVPKTAGESFKMGIELYWDDATGANNYEYTAKDNMKAGTTKRSFFYNAYDIWGRVDLVSQGNIEERQYIPDPKDKPGNIVIRTKVPKNANYLTLIAEDKQGERVANIVSELAIKDFIVEEGPDYKIVEYYWNGQNYFGQMVSPGEYTVKGLSYENIEPFYDMYFYNPGTTPWPNSSGTGEWGADHLPPISLASGGKYVFVGWDAAEGGHALIGLDENGNKMWGINRGAHIMTANSKYVYTVPGSSLYVESYATGDSYLMRVDAATGQFRSFVDENGNERDFQWRLSDILGINKEIVPDVVGISATEKYLAMATSYNNTSKYVSGGILTDYGDYITILDAETGTIYKKISAPGVTGIAYYGDDILYAILGTKLYKINPNTGEKTQVKVKENSTFAPSQIAADLDGNIVVFDMGKDMQIKAFNPNSGALVYTAAQKGGRPYVGEWQEQGLTEKVSAITVDYKGDIWAVEHFDAPRRVSMWSKTDGKLIRDYIGNAGYMSAGSSLHTTDETKAYTGAVEMELDRENQKYKVTRILWVPDHSKGQAFPLSATGNILSQHFSAEVNGVEKEFIFTSVASSGGNNENCAVLYVENDDNYFQPFFAMGRIGELLDGNPDTGAYGDVYMPSFEWLGADNTTVQRNAYGKLGTLHDEQFFIWNDLDGDASVEYEECEFMTDWYIQSIIYGAVGQSQWFPNQLGWGTRITSDFRYVAQDNLKRGYMISPTSYSEEGLPRYSLNSIKKLETDELLWAGSDNIILEDKNALLVMKSNGGGSTVAYQNGIRLVDLETGKDLWWYKNQYPGVHGSHYAQVQQLDGTVIGPLKIMGVAEIGGEQVFAIRGNMGCDYLMTTDGFFLKTLFRDSRLPKSLMADTIEEMVGRSMATVSGGGEPFSGWFGVQSDGVARILTSCGARGSVIAKIDGLETIERIDPVKISLTLKDIENAIEYNEMLANKSNTPESSGENKAEKDYTINIVDENAIVIDGNVGEWSNIPSVEISKLGAAESASAKIAYDTHNLYMLYEVSDISPMINKGSDYQLVFKTGDVVEFALSTSNNKSSDAKDGDMRILVTQFNGENIAVLMKTKDSQANGRESFTYASPVTSILFDTVKILEGAEIFVYKADEGYIVEARIPFDEIGFTPKEGGTVTGDMGIIGSNPDGTENAVRIYKYNQNTGLTKDIPMEAKIDTTQWRTITFGKSAQ